jgi:hypothetical protein
VFAPNGYANRRIQMTDNTTPTTHDCADHGCLAAMLGLEIDDTSAGKADIPQCSAPAHLAEMHVL